MDYNDLISRAALLDEFRSLCGPQTGDGWDNMGVHNLIMRQKAVNAAPVVRCKDCKYWKDQSYTPKWLPCSEIQTNGYWFCADGKRREPDA